MGEEAKNVLQTGASNAQWFIAAVVALSGETSLLELDRDLKKFANKNPKLARKMQDERNIPKAYEILYTLLHKSRTHSGGSTEKILIKKETTTALVVTDQNDYYALLGIDKNATQEEIEKAYQQKSKALQPDLLEKQLKLQGLSDSEIQARLQQAKRDFEYVQEAYSGIGNEENRKHYDEFREKFKSGSQQQGYSQTTSASASHATDWATLGLSPNPTQLEIEKAFKDLTRKYHPDNLPRQLGKDIKDFSPEEQKLYNELQERYKEISSARDRLRDREQLNKEKREALEKQKSLQTETDKVVVITTIPSTPKTNETEKALGKTEKFRKDVIVAKGVAYTAEEIPLLRNIPPDSTPDRLSAEASTGLVLYTGGIPAQEFSDKVAASNLSKDQIESLQRSAAVMECLEIVNPKRTQDLRTANQNPKVESIQQIPVTAAIPQPNQLSLQPQGGGFLKPLLDQATDILKSKFAGKLEGIATGFLKKRGVDISKGTVKTLVNKALKDGGKFLLNKGSAILARAGFIQAISSIVPGVGNLAGLIVQIVLEVAGKLLKFVKKALSNILRFITGKDDLKSQLKEISGVTLVASLATGAVVPAVISGVVFFSAIGTAAIITTMNPIFSAIFLVITSTVLAVSTPIIVGVITFVSLVLFITVIINNSAFVVPYGGIGVPDPFSPDPGSTEPPSGDDSYILVVKLASSEVPEENWSPYLKYSNEELETQDIVVSYRIDITAPDSDLLDITVSENCTSQGTTPDLECPDRSQWIPIPLEGYIPATETFSIEYTRTFTNPDYRDSLTTDTVSVSARIEGETAQTAIASAQVCIGDCPVDCPSGWPTEHGYITQGPDTPPPMSHSNNDAAIDIGIQGLTQPVYVYSTHGGTVRAFYSAGGGNTVEISSNCNGIEFRSSYQHLAGSFDDFVSTGEIIGPGIPIGIVDNTGSSTEGTHLHYEFIDSIPKPGGMLMQPPYIPEAIQPSSDCCSACGASYDPFCTTSW